MQAQQAVATVVASHGLVKTMVTEPKLVNTKDKLLKDVVNELDGSLELLLSKCAVIERIQKEMAK